MNLSLEGYKKAVEIYSIALIKNDTEMMGKLASKLQERLGISSNRDSFLFVQDTLLKYKNENQHVAQNIRILEFANPYFKEKDLKLGEFRRIRIKFLGEYKGYDIGRKSSDGGYFFIKGKDNYLFEDLKSLVKEIIFGHSLISHKSENKKEVDFNDIKSVVLIILTPIILLFGIEHFGEFKYGGYGGVSFDDLRVSTVTFHTPFGNVIQEDVHGQGIKYVQGASGRYRLNYPYSEKFWYYIKGISADFIYPLVVIVLGLIIFVFKKRFSIKMS